MTAATRRENPRARADLVNASLILERAPADWPLPPFGRLVRTWRTDDGRTHAEAFMTPCGYCLSWPSIGTFYFAPETPHVTFVALADSPVTWDTASSHFARVIQPLVLQALGAEVLHASAAVTATGAHLFTGMSGSGKSTLAFALAQRGVQQVADDMTVLDLAQPDTILIRPLPFEPRLRSAARAWMFGRSHGTPTAAKTAAPVAAVYALAPDPGLASTAALTRKRPQDAFTTLLTHAHCFDEEDTCARRRLVNDYLRMAESVPVFELRYQPDLTRLPHLVDFVMRAIHGQPVGLEPSRGARA